MITTLHIKNIGIIDEININLNEGFNVLTGETGAGKSIIIDAINAILGERTSRELIRTGSNNAEVSAYFEDISDNVVSILNEIGVTSEDDRSLLVSRKISSDGKNSCKINGVSVTVSLLKKLGQSLINVHGQLDNHNLLNEELHYTYIDNFARGSFDTPVKSLTTFNGNTLPVWNGKLDVLMEDLKPVNTNDSTVVVFAGTEKSAKNLAETLNDENFVSVYCSHIPEKFPKGAVCVLAGSLTSGFSYPREKLFVFTYSKVYQSSTRKRNKVFKARDTIHSLDELKKGDYIVHAVHGIGIFDGVGVLKSRLFLFY
mgnify:CR=1 FL=1